MGYIHTDPACYLVAWDAENIIKAGYSHCQRWRKFLLRGARLERVDFFPRCTPAFALETEMDDYLMSVGTLAFTDRHDAAEHLGTDGGGWKECIRVPCVADALHECDRIASAFIERTAGELPPSYARTGRTNALTGDGAELR